MMRCAKGIFAKGIWGCTRFPLLRWEQGSETPSFLMLRPRERGSLRLFSPPQEGVSDPFSHRLFVASWKKQGGSGTEPEAETGTVRTVFLETESGNGTAGTVFQEPKPEPEPSFPVKLR